MIPHKQLTLGDIYTECQNFLESDKPAFLSLLEKHINLNEFIPDSFRRKFYSCTGRPREYPLIGLLWALILQKIFTIPTDILMLTFLHYSEPLRNFCGFDKVPDPSKITRFKQGFLSDLQSVFENLVDVTEPICQDIDAAKADMTIFDSSGIEAWVKENNPKYANRIIKQLKAYKKAVGLDDYFDPYKVAYGSMPSCAATNPQIKQRTISAQIGTLRAAAVISSVQVMCDLKATAARPNKIIIKYIKKDNPTLDINHLVLFIKISPLALRPVAVQNLLRESCVGGFACRLPVMHLPPTAVAVIAY